MLNYPEIKSSFSIALILFNISMVKDINLADHIKEEKISNKKDTKIKSVGKNKNAQMKKTSKTQKKLIDSFNSLL